MLNSYSLKKAVSLILLTIAVLAGKSNFLFAEDGPQSIITIDKADKSEYKKDPVNGGDCIILSGNVKISVARGSDKTTITADLVNYNRTSEMLFAEGDVSLEQTGGSAGGEKISARSLLFNTSTLEGIFDNGRAVQTSSDAINLPSGSTLIVASDIFGRDSGGTIAFKGGELTFCDDENPHWKIRASRIWLLPGGEFAFFSAILFVGRVPLLYLPAFYYPKDELIFNPAMGYKFREGYFVNTTTYLYGRKPADATSTKSTSTSDSDEKIDVFSFMKTNSMKKQVREGIVLHNLDEDFSGDTTNHVKVMADWYSNLGAMLGTDVVFKPKKYISNFEFNAELGFSNTIFKTGGVYQPYNRLNEKVIDGSNFLGKELPFRYQVNLKTAISKPLSLSLSMPIYSDPYFDYDFNKRAETMDWIDFLMSGVATEDTNDQSTVSSFSWQLSGNYNFNLPEIIKPYVSSFSISSFSSSIQFSSRSISNSILLEREEAQDDSDWITYTPERMFYYPSQITPLKTSVRLSGTLFQYPFANKTTSNKDNVSLVPPSELDDSEKKTEDNKAGDEKTAEKTDSTEEKTEEDEKRLFEALVLPVISTVSPSVRTINPITYKLNYSINPDFTSQISYASSNLSKPEDFDWETVQSTYFQIQSPSTLTSTLGIKDGFLSLTDTFNFNPVYQKHPYISTDESKGGVSESSANSTKLTDYKARKLDLTDTNALSFKPFYYTEHFSNTSLTWNTTVKMIRTNYIGTDVDNPEWEYLTTDLTDEECVTTHNLNLVLAAKEGEYSQSLSCTTTLFPQVDAYSGTLTLTFPYTTFTASTGIKQKSSKDDTWVKQDLSQSLNFRFFNSKLNFTQSYIYSLEEKKHQSLKFSLSGFGAQLAYTFSYTTGYDFEIDPVTKVSKGWKANTEKEFQPTTLSFAYANTSKTYKYLAEKITCAPTISTGLVYDCIRPTSSYFTFIPGLTFKVNEFLNVTFNAETRNNAIYRYFCSDEDFEKYYKSTGYRNPFEDLMDSYRFDDDEKRKASNFKMKNFKIQITHELCDWDFNCEWSVKPRLVDSEYRFDPYFTLSVSWRPMAGMKTQVIDEYGEWSLK